MYKMEIREVHAQPSRPTFHFRPFELVISSPVELTSLLGALMAYGSADIMADTHVSQLGLDDYFSGNVRKDARKFAKLLAEAAGLPEPDFSTYFESETYRRASASGRLSKPRGDLANNYDSITDEDDR